MEKLALAVEIAELADEAVSDGKPVDVRNEATRLVAAHPEADSTERQIIETLVQEIAAART
jgi:hypothetical protein